MSGPFQRGSAPPALAAVVVSYNTREALLACLGALRRHVALPLEVVVVDNASADGSAAAASREFPTARLIENAENLGFARANNQGLRVVRAPRVLLINSDAEVRPGAVEALASLLDAQPDLGLVGPRTLSADGTIQVSTGPALTPLAEWRQRRLVRGVQARRPRALRAAERRYSRAHEPGWISAACLLARREALESVGGFDEAFFLYEEDVDLCQRLRAAGWRLLYTPAAVVTHQLGRSMALAPERARIEYHRSHLRYYRKHNGPLMSGLLRLHLLGRAALNGATALLSSRHERARTSAALARLALRWR